MTAWWAASSISAASTTQTSETRTLKSASRTVFCGDFCDFVWWAFGLCARLPSLRRFLRGCLRRQKSRSRRRARGMVGEFREGRAATREGLSWSHSHNQRYLEAELWRVDGELAHRSGETAAATASLRRAVEIAIAQGARWLELRALHSLASRFPDRAVREQLADLVETMPSGHDLPAFRAATAFLSESG